MSDGQIKYDVDKEIGFYLDQLIGGLYGKDRTKVLRTLVRDQIVLLKKDGQLRPYVKEGGDAD